jgi:hypothetical protein
MSRGVSRSRKHASLPKLVSTQLVSTHDYSSTSLSNIGIGHGAVDAGGGYTYFNPQTGHELSAVLGFTYNLINPSTQYQNGVDMHLDWGASQFLTKQVQVGLVDYLLR